MSDNIYFGRGTAEMFDDYIDFINYVFGFNGNSSDFKKLLPKLYKYDYEPAVSSYVAIDDGKLKAAVGAFDHDITVCGHYLKTRGIGNVAVHPYTRGSGYMKKLMNIALDDMIADGVVLTVLGGRRQRYNYFSYDKLGSAISMSFNSDNMRHVFGKDRNHQIKFSTLKENDLNAIKEIKSLSESKPYYAIRSDEKYFEILSSWSQKTYVGYIDNEFVGYAVVKSGVSEMLLKDESMIQEFVCALFDHLGNSSLQISIPAFLPNYVDALIGICESYCLETSKFFSVLNYKKVVEAFMELKATYTDLPDGKIVLDINGKAGNEKIAVSVNNGKISVEYTDDAADLTLEHIEAMNLLFAPISIKRDRLPDFVKMWFPLPIYVYSSDAV
jgi:predicted acetyltransferase